MKIEILLVDDQFLILEGIKAILEPEPAIKVVGTAYDGKTAIALVKKLRPNILLIDIEMPNMNGISATKYICKYFPNTKVIVLTSHKNQDYIAEALLAGASGYLWKGNLIEDLKQEIYAFGKGYSNEICKKHK
jgi:DNA-binding NarL/FixJ family response regulator